MAWMAIFQGPLKFEAGQLGGFQSWPGPMTVFPASQDEERCKVLAAQNSQTATQIYEGIACVLAKRVRLINKELRALRS